MYSICSIYVLYSLISAESQTSMMISDDEELDEVEQDVRIEMTATKVPST